MPEERTTSSTGGQKGVKLARFDLIPVGPLTELAEHYGKGALKYANHQWRNGYEWSKSYAALLRHLTAFWAGFDFDVCSNDPDGCSFVDNDGNPFEPQSEDTCYNHTGSHHMAAVAWHAFCLLEFKDVHPDHDDRYRPDGPDPDFDAVAEEIIGGRRFELKDEPQTGATQVQTIEGDDSDRLTTRWVVDYDDERPQAHFRLRAEDLFFVEQPRVGFTEEQRRTIQRVEADPLGVVGQAAERRARRDAVEAVNRSFNPLPGQAYDEIPILDLRM